MQGTTVPDLLGICTLTLIEQLSLCDSSLLEHIFKPVYLIVLF